MSTSAGSTAKPCHVNNAAEELLTTGETRTENIDRVTNSSDTELENKTSSTAHVLASSVNQSVLYSYNESSDAKSWTATDDGETSPHKTAFLQSPFFECHNSPTRVLCMTRHLSALP